MFRTDGVVLHRYAFFRMCTQGDIIGCEVCAVGWLVVTPKYKVLVPQLGLT